MKYSSNTPNVIHFILTFSNVLGNQLPQTLLSQGNENNSTECISKHGITTTVHTSSGHPQRKVNQFRIGFQLTAL